MLRIGKPYIEWSNDKARLCAKLSFPDFDKVAWFEVDKEYGRYLTDDRADAFVAAFLTSAMQAGENIVSEAPVTKRLLYQLNTQLIPAVVVRTNKYHKMKVVAETTEAPLECHGAVGIGWTAGVDCFHTFKRYSQTQEESFKITHLVVADIGTFFGKKTKPIYEIFYKRAKEMADDFNLKVVGIRSNIQKIVDEDYLAVGAFRLASTALALQGLFKLFLHSSSYPYNLFEIRGESSPKYEMFLLKCLETDHTFFYSAMGDATRWQKTEELADFAPAWKRLHPCAFAADTNCGKCPKCEIVFTSFYAMGKLERFSEVIDVEKFKENMDVHLESIAQGANTLYKGEVYEYLKKKGMITPKLARIASLSKAKARFKQRQTQEEKKDE